MYITKKDQDRFLTRCKYYAEYEDGTHLYFFGSSEEECMQCLTDLQDRYGDCEFYTAVDDEYYTGGLCTGA